VDRSDTGSRKRQDLGGGEELGTSRGRLKSFSRRAMCSLERTHGYMRRPAPLFAAVGSYRGVVGAHFCARSKGTSSRRYMGRVLFLGGKKTVPSHRTRGKECSRRWMQSLTNSSFFREGDHLKYKGVPSNINSSTNRRYYKIQV